MSARYRFSCKGCGFQCVGSFGVEKTVYHTKLVRFCRNCHSVDSYQVSNLAGLTEKLICNTCRTSKFLEEWDGLTCPLCASKLRAIGSDVDKIKLIWEY